MKPLLNRCASQIVAKLSRAVMLLVLLKLAACAGGSSSGSRLTGTESARELPAGLQLASPGQLSALLRARDAAFTPEALVRTAAEFDDALPSNRVMRSGDSVQFSPNHVSPGGETDGLAFATWLFSVPDFNGPAHLYLNFETAPVSQTELHILMANFETQRWERFAYVPGSFTDFGSMPSFINAEGSVLAVLLMTGNSGAKLTSLRLGDPIVSGELQISTASQRVDSGVILDANELSVNGAEIVNYSWDFDGDGSIELDSGLEKNQAHVFQEAGVFQPAVRMRTSDGLSVSRSGQIRIVNGDWELSTIVNPLEPTDFVFGPQLAVVNGLPALAFERFVLFDEELQEGNFNTLHYMQATDAIATSWGGEITVADYSDKVGELFTLCEVAGRPAILFMDGTPESRLYFIRASAADGGAWAEEQEIDNQIDPLGEASMAVVGGTPIIAYLSGNGSLLAAHAQDAEGTNWLVDVDLGTDAEEVFLADGRGRPMCSYDYQNTSSGIYLGSDPSDLTWDNTALAGPAGSDICGLPLGTGLALAQILDNGGYPNLSLTTNPDGASGWLNFEVENLANCDHMSIGRECMGNLGIVCYQHVASGTLRAAFISSLNAECYPEEVDNGEQVGAFCSLVVSDGVPMIAYQEAVNGALKFAVMR